MLITIYNMPTFACSNQAFTFLKSGICKLKSGDNLRYININFLRRKHEKKVSIVFIVD